MRRAAGGSGKRSGFPMEAALFILRFFDISKILKYYFKILLSKNYSAKKILVAGDGVDFPPARFTMTSSGIF